MAPNNHTSATVRIMDAADLEASISAPASVVQGAAETGSVTLTNHGPDAVHARLRFVVVCGAPTNFSPLDGLFCTGPVSNLTGTIFSYSCSTVGPPASGASAIATFVFQPSPTASSLTMTATATKVGATVIDSNLLNNKQVVPVSITPPTHSG